MSKIEWIYKCGNDWKYCKDGFCDRYNQLKEDHKRPAVEMSKEWFEVTGKEWSASAIATMFGDLTSSKPASCENPKPISQERFWGAVAKRLEKMCKDISEKGELPADISRKKIGRIKDAKNTLMFLLEQLEGLEGII